MAVPDEEARRRIEAAYQHYKRSYLTRSEMRAMSHATFDGQKTLICQVVRRQYAKWTGTTNPKYHRLPLEMFKIPAVYEAEDARFLKRTGMLPIHAPSEPSRENEREVQLRILENLDAIEPGLTLLKHRVLETKKSGR
jgi:hypothetical protein